MDEVLAVFGAGSLGKEILDIAVRVNKLQHRWQDIVFADNYPKSCRFYGTRVYTLPDLITEYPHTQYVIANGEPAARREIYEQLAACHCELVSLTDPTAVISPTAELGKGVIVTPFSSVSSDVCVEDNVLIQSYVRVGHDIRIGRHSVVSANTAVGGSARIGQACFIGMGAVIREDVVIGEKAVIGMGSVVYRNVESEATVAGSPARRTMGSKDGKVFHK